MPPRLLLGASSVTRLVAVTVVFAGSVVCLVFFVQHPSRELVWRRSPTRRVADALSLPASRVGSLEWRARYPPRNQLGPAPKTAWQRRYRHLLSRVSGPGSLDGGVPVAALDLHSGLAEYPIGVELGSQRDGVCSYRRAGCLRGPAEDRGEGLLDTWEGQPGCWAVNFDDGPLPPSLALLDFLEDHEERATHFWIGSNVLEHPSTALATAERGMHLAVHTWSHPHLTTLSDEQVLGELGWTMQIIFDLTGKVPRYFRPPYGDVDNRIRAIAKHVFGLAVILWNGDSSDWSLNQTWAIGDFVDPPMQGFRVADSVSNILERARNAGGAGSIMLEHELSDESVAAFIATYGQVRQAGWRTATVPECIGQPWYQ